MDIERLITIVSICTSLSSIIFALLAFKRSERQENRRDGKNEGLILADIGYIKACIDRVEKNLNKVDELYLDVSLRLVKVEESLVSFEKRVNTLCLNGGG